MQEEANEVVLDLQLSDGGYELDRQTQPPGDYLQDSSGAYEAGQEASVGRVNMTATIFLLRTPIFCIF